MKTRRQFLATAALAGFPAIVSSRSPNSKLNIAIIGCGGRGGGNMRQVSSESIVALCDVFRPAIDKALKDHPDARTYVDFRELYAAETDKIDAVVVSTTEHTHAFATLPALRAGKHVYCEKPLTRDVHECRVVTEAAKKTQVATQMGTQIHAGENFRRVVELVQAKVVGEIKEVHVWVSRAWGLHPSAEIARANKDPVPHITERPKEAMPVPKGLDWDLWIGPAPFRPYHKIYLPGRFWYRWWDFGNGTMSDLGSHYNDLPFWALDLDAPLTVEARGPKPHPEIAPASMSAHYTYGPRGDRPGLSLSWYQGTEKPELWKKGKIPQWSNGHLFVGENGMILSDYKKHLVLPGDKAKSFTRPPESIPPSPGQHREWLEACKTGSPALCHFGYSGPLTEANHLGNVAFRSGRKIQWDAANLKIPNAPEAEQFIRRDYRKGWSLGD